MTIEWYDDDQRVDLYYPKIPGQRPPVGQRRTLLKKFINWIKRRKSA